MPQLTVVFYEVFIDLMVLFEPYSRAQEETVVKCLQTSQLIVVFVCAAFGLVFTSGFGITAGAHRLWSHRAYKAAWPLRLLLVFLFTISGQVRPTEPLPLFISTYDTAFSQSKSVLTSFSVWFSQLLVVYQQKLYHNRILTQNFQI